MSWGSDRQISSGDVRLSVAGLFRWLERDLIDFTRPVAVAQDVETKQRGKDQEQGSKIPPEICQNP